MIRELGSGRLKTGTPGTPEMGDLVRTVVKEGLTGLLLGSLLGVILIPFVLFLGISLRVSVVVALTLPLINVFSNSVGAFLPFVVQKGGYDAAVIAAPLLTTLIDTLGMYVMRIVVFFPSAPCSY